MYLVEGEGARQQAGEAGLDELQAVARPWQPEGGGEAVPLVADAHVLQLRGLVRQLQACKVMMMIFAIRVREAIRADVTGTGMHCRSALTCSLLIMSSKECAQAAAHDTGRETRLRQAPEDGHGGAVVAQQGAGTRHRHYQRCHQQTCQQDWILPPQTDI